MVILHVLAPGEAGGLEGVARALAAGQAAQGHAVHLAAILDRYAPTPFQFAGLADSGVAVVQQRHAARDYLREALNVASLCRSVRPDVVHTHGYRPDVVDAAVARRLGIPTVTTVHGFTGGGVKNRLYERLQRAAYRRFDAIVAVSRPLAARLARDRRVRRRLHTIPNAWDGVAPSRDRVTARRELGIAEDRLHVGWVGRLSREKGPDLLLDALARLSDLPLAVSIFGEGRERSALEARAVSLGVDDHVRWHGVVPEASQRFPSFDVFVLSSRSEGTPLVLFEAMAAGVPIVATSVGGVPDVVSADEALLVPPGDSVALARAIGAVARDPAAARARAIRARARLGSEFELAPWVGRYERIYHTVQPSRGNGSRNA